MPIVAGDWSVDRATGNIRYIGDDHGGASPSYATVIEFHRWLQDLADDASFIGDDELDITDPTPSERATDNFVTLINGYNIDQATSEHIYDGSIVQAGGADIWDGIVNFGNPEVQIQIIQNGAVLSDDWWNFGGGGLNADANNGISHRFMLKTRTAGTDIDLRRIIGTARRFGFSYSEFIINATSRGNNVLALADATDLNNATASGTVATWTTITNLNQGYVGIDVNNDTVDEFFYSEWNRDIYSINQFYERMKYLTRDGSAETLYGLSGELFRGITHEVTLTTPRSGTFNAFEPVSWSGGTGQMLAINSTTAGTTMWIQLLTGNPPTNAQLITGTTSTATATASGTATARPLSRPFCGVSTGSALIGAYGFGVEYADLSNADLLLALDNVTYQPPNNVTFTVNGLVVGEDRVLVGPEAGGTLDLDQFTLNGALTGAAVTAVVINGSIPVDTPNTGTIRILRASGLYSLHAYTSWTGSTFTIASTDFSGDNAANGADVFISYLDKLAASTSESFTGVYVSPRSLFIRVRSGTVGTPIKTFETTGTLGAAGGSTTVIRTPDV
jgi:hypothetical protein